MENRCRNVSSQEGCASGVCILSVDGLPFEESDDDQDDPEIHGEYYDSLMG